MKALLISLMILAGGLSAASSVAQTAPAVTATCKDSTTFSGTKRTGACRGHGGVQAFNSVAPVAAGSSVGTSAVTPAAPVPTRSAPMPVSSGGAGQVWVNTASKVYHCQGDRDYGHTKVGSYMSEAAAKAAGDRPSRGKTCS